MRRFVEGADRGQSTLFPECLEDWIGEDNPVRVIDVFVDELDWPTYHPSTLLKVYIYLYLNRVQSSRRLERDASRNVEVMWLTGRLVPDHKTIPDFRKDAGDEHRRREATHGGDPDVRRGIGLVHTLGTSGSLTAATASHRVDSNYISAS